MQALKALKTPKIPRLSNTLEEKRLSDLREKVRSITADVEMDFFVIDL